MFGNIFVNDLKKIDSSQIIDIRSIEKYNNGHIMNSKNIPITELLGNPSKYLLRHKRYYIYCQKGNQSKRVCTILTRNGYNVVNILGGYEAWVMDE